jgi:predicted HicB family RNase H-like nuclease
MNKDFKSGIDTSVERMFMSQSQGKNEHLKSLKKTKKQDKGGFMGIEIVKQQRETKSKALTLLVKPSTYEALKKEATSKTMSINEVANQLFEQYVSR